MNTPPQLRLRTKEVIRINDKDHPVYRYGIITNSSSYALLGYYLEEGLPTFHILVDHPGIRVTEHPIEALSVREIHFLNTLEDNLNIWYQYTDDDPFDNVVIDGLTITVETVENVVTYLIKYITHISRTIESLQTTLTLTNGDKVELMLRDETHKAIIAAVSGQTKSYTLNL